VRVEPTDAFADAQLTARAGRLSRDVGERAALEIIRTYPLGKSGRALLLTDDRDVEKVVVMDPDRLILLTTWDYLRQLEEARRIQSAAAVIDAVRVAGRNAPKDRLWEKHDPEIRDAVRRILDTAHHQRAPRGPKR